MSLWLFHRSRSQRLAAPFYPPFPKNLYLKGWRNPARKTSKAGHDERVGQEGAREESGAGPAHGVAELDGVLQSSHWLWA